jgi:CDP-diacylglycerol--glycerol-3-phosphate 3-phosphatidyltransferase
VTLLGFIVTIGAAVLIGFGFLLAGGLVFLLASTLDMMDGALARLTGKASRLGALLDSTFDRLGEAAFFTGLAVYGVFNETSNTGLLAYMVSLVIALALSQTVSYLRARGESLGIDMRAGLLTRTERVLILGIGTALGWVTAATALIAALSAYTLVERLWHIIRNVRHSG